MTAILIIVALIVGALIGTVGVGGILLIPALNGFAGLSTHVSMATALFSFIFTGVVGTYLYHRRGTINWAITIPVCAGGLVSGYFGAMANAIAPAAILNMLLAAVIIFAGLYALFPAKGGTINYEEGNKKQLIQLVCIGAVVGFGSGLTGVGGPVLSVPIMVIVGFHPLTAIATSQVIQITAALSGSIGNMQNGLIDMQVAWWITLVELVGVGFGVRLAHAVPTGVLKKMVSGVCIVVGSFIALRTVL